MFYFHNLLTKLKLCRNTLKESIGMHNGVFCLLFFEWVGESHKEKISTAKRTYREVHSSLSAILKSLGKKTLKSKGFMHYNWWQAWTWMNLGFFYSFHVIQVLIFRNVHVLCSRCWLWEYHKTYSICIFPFQNLNIPGLWTCLVPRTWDGRSWTCPRKVQDSCLYSTWE